MTNDLQQVLTLLQAVKERVDIPFWYRGDFLIAIIIGIAGLIYSILAFREARQAKRAATEAGKTVKIQTIIIDLSEISQKLEKLQMDIHFNEARDLLNEITRKLLRISAPFEKDVLLSEKITGLRDALSKAKESLNKVRPTDATKEEVAGTTYYAMEGSFAAINNYVADVLGLFEKKTINFGDDNAKP
jgi:hypothetical protein